jgi:D-amino peptidase
MMRAVLLAGLVLAAQPPAPRVSLAKKPRILLYFDMEGISGINRVHQVLFSFPADYQPSREFLTGDVNAAIRGLVAGGAGEIIVTDAHGSGNPDPDILLDKMDKRATFEWRDTPFDPYRDLPDTSYQAIVCIGMHSRANTDGFMAHTVTVEPSYKVNQLDITETEIIAHFAAPFHIPVIMVSGDDVLRKQIAERFPQAEYGLVKNAKGRASADLLPEREAWSNIEAAAKRAMEKLGRFKSFDVAPGYQWEMGWQNAAQADFVERGSPGVKRVSPTSVGYQTTTFREGYDRAAAMIGLTGAERNQLLIQILRKRPDWPAIQAALTEARFKRLVEPDAFKLDFPAPPAAATPAAGAAKKRYHGDS